MSLIIKMKDGSQTVVQARPAAKRAVVLPEMSDERHPEFRAELIASGLVRPPAKPPGVDEFGRVTRPALSPEMVRTYKQRLIRAGLLIPGGSS